LASLAAFWASFHALLTPAVKGGNMVTLAFWQAWQFLSIIAVLKLLNSGLGFIILHILHCCATDLDLSTSFKVRRAGLGARTSDIL